MKISQLVRALNNAKKKVGDAEVMGLCAQENGSPWDATFTVVAL